MFFIGCLHIKTRIFIFFFKNNFKSLISTGVNICYIIGYSFTSYSSGMAMKETAMEDAGAGRNLMPGQVDVEAEVSATFSIQ